MAAWGKPAAGAWASAVEEEEEKHGVIQAPAAKEKDFPSLGAAVAVKDSKKKKKQVMSLGQFQAGPGGTAARRRAVEDVRLSLPTAPRVREEGEEDTGPRLGGAFGQQYGTKSRYGDRDDDERGDREDMGPSRADASDRWGENRTFQPTGAGGGDSYGGRDGGRDRERGGFGSGGYRDTADRGGSRDRGGFGDGPSRADTESSWGASRVFQPSGDAPRRGGGFGDDRPRDSFRDSSPRDPSRADTEDRWSHRPAPEVQPSSGGGFGDRRHGDDGGRRGFGDSYRDGGDRRGLSPGGRSNDGDRDRPWLRATGTADAEAPRERPRIKLAPRSADAAAAAAPAEAPAAAAPARSSLFGAARPREEILKEQGRDPLAEEAKYEHHRPEPKHSAPREETAEEAALKSRIAELSTRVEAGEGDAPLDASAGAGEPGAETVRSSVEALEKQLHDLSLELDAKAQASKAGRDTSRGRDASRGDRSQDRSSTWRREGAPPAARPAAPPRGSSSGRREGWRDGGGGGDDRGRSEGPRSFRDAPPAAARQEAPRAGGW